MKEQTDTNDAIKLGDDRLEQRAFDYLDIKYDEKDWDTAGVMAAFAASETAGLTARLEAAEKERDAEKKDHKLTIQVFRQQELIWKEKFNDLEKERNRFKGDRDALQQMDVKLRVENHELRAEVERLRSFKRQAQAECMDINCMQTYPHAPH